MLSTLAVAKVQYEEEAEKKWKVQSYKNYRMEGKLVRKVNVLQLSKNGYSRMKEKGKKSRGENRMKKQGLSLGDD